MDWSSPHPCGVINVATRYCLTAGEGGDAMCHVAGGRWQWGRGIRGDGITTHNGAPFHRTTENWGMRALYSPFTC